MLCLALLIISRADLLAAAPLSHHGRDVSLGARVQRAVEGYIKNTMPWRPEEVRITFAGLEIPAAGIDEGSLVLEVERIGTGEYVGDPAFLVRIGDRRGPRRTVTVHARMEILRPVVVARESLERNKVLDHGDVTVTRRWVRRIDPKTATSLDQVLGKRLTNNVPAGGEISTYLLREPVLVKRGNVVRLHLERGPIQIATLGICEEDGTEGAIVRVKNMSSQRVIYGRVRGENYVVIDF